MQREFLDYNVLGEVGVLVLVHKDVGKTAGQDVERFGVVAQEYVHIDQDVVEIHHAGLLELALVESVDSVHIWLVASEILVDQILVYPVGLRHHKIVFRRADAGKHLFGLVHLVVETQFLDAMLDCRNGISRVRDGEVRRIAQELRIFTQKSDEDRMESARHHAPGLRPAHKQGDPFLHLTSRLLGKCQGQDCGGIHAGSKSVSHSRSQNPCLSGTGSGNNQYRPVHRLYRPSLLIVQAIENCIHFVFHTATKIGKKLLSSHRLIANLINLYKNVQNHRFEKGSRRTGIRHA